MLNFTPELQRIRRDGIDGSIIKAILKRFELRRLQMIELYERYKAGVDGVPIFRRTLTDSSKVNNKLNDDYFSEIVDIKTGYFAGRPITYGYSKDVGDFKAASDAISRFTMRNHIADQDSEVTKMAAICGYGARLVYVDVNGEERVMNVDPFDAVILSETGISEPEFGLRLYEVQGTQNNTRLKIEFYDGANIYFFSEVRRGTYELDPEAEKNPRPHLFNRCPLVGFPNNDELQGDAEKVLSLIDAYDRTLSDVNSEIEAFRLAYMAFKGGAIDEETIREAQRMGAFEVPEDGDISFITKDLNDSAVEHHLDRIHSNIYRFSKTPDLSDETFSGNASGVALKFKLFGLETKCTTFERKMQAALTHMFACVADVWQMKRITVDPYEMIFEFKRNFPLDLANEADTTSKLKGMVSEQTRLGLLSFIDDAEYEQQLMDDEAEQIAKLNPLGGEDQNNDDASGQVQGADKPQIGFQPT